MLESLQLLADLITGFGKPFFAIETRNLRNLSSDSLFKIGRDAYERIGAFGRIAAKYDCVDLANCPDHPELSWSEHTSHRHANEYDQYQQVQFYDRITRELMRRSRRGDI